MLIGMEVNLRAPEAPFIFLALLLGTVIGAKLTGCWIAINKGGQSSRERVLIMFGVLAQGEVGILVAAYLFSRGVLSPPSFSVGIMAVVLLTIVSPVLLRIAFSGFDVQETCAQVGAAGRSDSYCENP